MKIKKAKSKRKQLVAAFANWKFTENVKSKGEARQLGIDFQNWASEQSLSYGELSRYQNALYILAKKFGLVREFKENGII